MQGDDAVIGAEGSQVLTPSSPFRSLSASSQRGCCGLRCIQKSPCPGQGGFGRSEWDPIQTPSLSIYLLCPTCVASQQCAGGWGLHIHPTKGRGVGLLGSKGPLL